MLHINEAEILIQKRQVTVPTLVVVLVLTVSTLGIISKPVLFILICFSSISFIHLHFQI